MECYDRTTPEGSGGKFLSRDPTTSRIKELISDQAFLFIFFPEVARKSRGKVKKELLITGYEGGNVIVAKCIIIVLLGAGEGGGGILINFVLACDNCSISLNPEIGLLALTGEKKGSLSKAFLSDARK